MTASQAERHNGAKAPATFMLASNAEHSIAGDGENSIGVAEILLGNSDDVFAVVLLTENAQTGGFCVFTFLDFDGYDFVLNLQDKIYFGCVVIFPVKQLMTVGCKGLRHVVFG